MGDRRGKLLDCGGGIPNKPCAMRSGRISPFRTFRRRKGGFPLDKTMWRFRSHDQIAYESTL